MTEKMKINQSRVKAWRQCRQLFHYKYVDRIVGKVKSRPLQFGTIVHKMIEAHANGDDPFATLDQINLKDAKLFEAERELYGDMVQDIRYIMTDYFKFWKGQDLVYHRHAGRNAEHKFEVDISSEVTFKGKIDAFAKRSKNPLKWLVEHKTFKRKPSEDHRWKSIQSAVYIRAVQMLGWVSLDGTCWDYIGSKPPTEPKILKNGQLSRAKIVTLPSVVNKFLDDNRLSRVHYKEFIAAVAEDQVDYFDRVYTPLSENVINDVFEDFVATAHEIVKLGDKDQTKTIALHCDYCEYESLCRAKLYKLDYDYIKEREYHADVDEEEVAIESVS